MTYFVGKHNYDEFESCTLEMCIDYLKTQSVIGIDIETSRKYPKGKYDERIYQPGLDPHLSRIIMIQVGTLEKRFVIDARYIDCSPLKEILEDKNILKIGHNLVFEGKFFLLHLNLRIVNVWDCMIVEKLLYNGLQQSNSLKSLMNRYLGIKSQTEETLFENSSKEIEAIVKDLEESYLLSGKPYNEDDLYDQAIVILEDKETVDKSIRMGFVNMKDEPFTLDQILYGELDITAPLRIYELQKKGRLVYNDVWNYEAQENVKQSHVFNPEIGIKLENKFTQVIAEVSLIGLKIDTNKWAALYESNYLEWTNQREFLNNYVVENHPDHTASIDLFNDKPTCAVDWNSPLEVTKFFQKLGLAVQEMSKTTRKMSWTVGAKSLIRSLPNNYKEKFFKHEFPESIENGKDLVLAYLLYKKTGQLCTAFGHQWLRYVHPLTGRVHSNFQQILNTTRMSSTRPNVQQIPGSEDYRQCFTCDQGFKNINTDYASQEVRVLAEVSEVESLRDFFIAEHPIFKQDFHSFTATQMFRVVYSKPDLIINKKDHADERSTAKALTFSLSYGASHKSVARDMGITEDEGEKFVNGYFDGFQGLRENFEKVKKQALQRGWIEIDSYTKRRYFFPHFEKMKDLQKQAMSYYPENYRQMTSEEKALFKDELYLEFPEVKEYWKEWSILKGKLERAALNFRIQGNSAGMIKLAAILIYNYRWDNNVQEEFYTDNIVHDELNHKSIEEKAEDYAKIIETLMIQAGKYFCPNVPMGAESKIGDYWYH